MTTDGQHADLRNLFLATGPSIWLMCALGEKPIWAKTFCLEAGWLNTVRPNQTNKLHGVNNYCCIECLPCRSHVFRMVQ